MKSFNQWLTEEVEDQFNLKRHETLPHLEQWLAAPITLTALQEQQLEILQKKLRHFVEAWNEAELKMHFISLLINLVDYETEHYHAFAERPMSLTIGKQKIKGVVDLLIAQGWQIPKQPFFCLHEYKPSVPSSEDPIGQTLIAMVVAQHLNQTPRPMYGVCVVGRFWYFLVLVEQDYAISLAYDATKDDLFKLVAILLYLKVLIQA